MCSWTDQKFLMPLSLFWLSATLCSHYCNAKSKTNHPWAHSTKNTPQINRLPQSMCNGVKGAVRSFISRKWSAAKKGLDWFHLGPVLPKKVHSPFYFVQTFYMLLYRTDMNLMIFFFTLLISYDSFKMIFILIFTASLWLLYILSGNPLPNILHICETIGGAFFFSQNRSHMQEGWHGNIQSV